MIRLIRLAFLVVVAGALIVVAMANRTSVTLTAWPRALGDIAGLGAPSLSMPLFVVIFGAILCGLALGFIWEWLREWKHRSSAEKHRRESVRLKREVDRMKAEKNQGKDEVLALLEDAG